MLFITKYACKLIFGPQPASGRQMEPKIGSHEITFRQDIESAKNHLSDSRNAIANVWSWLEGLAHKPDSAQDKYHQIMTEHVVWSIPHSKGTAKHQNSSNRGGSISEISQKQWCEHGKKVLHKLNDNYALVNDVQNHFNVESAVAIDNKRDEILLLVNPRWRNLKTEEFELPSETCEIERGEFVLLLFRPRPFSHKKRLQSIMQLAVTKWYQ
jgi:hypothetical protein